MAQKNDKNKNGIISHGLVAENRRARYDYEIGETLEAVRRPRRFSPTQREFAERIVPDEHGARVEQKRASRPK